MFSILTVLYYLFLTREISRRYKRFKLCQNHKTEIWHVFSFASLAE